MGEAIAVGFFVAGALVCGLDGFLVGIGVGCGDGTGVGNLVG